MARLSAHGSQLIRVSKEQADTGSLTDWSRRTRTFHVDGVVLEKLDVRFRASETRPQDSFRMPSRRHSYGWKRRGRVRPGASVAEIIDAYARNGWTLDYVCPDRGRRW